MYCKQCNQNVPGGAEFCPFCGGLLSENTLVKIDEIPENQNDVPKKQHEIPKEQNEATNRASNNAILDTVKKINFMNRFPENSSMFKTVLIFAAVVIVLLAGLNIYQLMATATLKTDYAALESDMYEKNEAITSLQAEKSTLESELYDAEEKADFLDERISLVADNGTNLYHTYDCIYFEGDFFAYNTENAIWLGYYACPYCH